MSGAPPSWVQRVSGLRFAHGDTPDDDHPGEYKVPDHNSTFIRGIHRVLVGRLFEATEMSQAYYTPPGAYKADSRIVLL